MILPATLPFLVGLYGVQNGDAHGSEMKTRSRIIKPTKGREFYITTEQQE